MDDLISRQDAIKAVTYGALSSATLFGRSDAGMTALRETVRAIEQLPSAQPQRMKGKWIDCSSSEHYKCSVCGYRTGFWLEDNDTLTEWLSDFCPNCGADMRGEQDG